MIALGLREVAVGISTQRMGTGRGVSNYPYKCTKHKTRDAECTGKCWECIALQTENEMLTRTKAESQDCLKKVSLELFAKAARIAELEQCIREASSYLLSGHGVGYLAQPCLQKMIDTMKGNK